MSTGDLKSAGTPDLLGVARNFEVSGPDSDGLVWLVLHGIGTSGHALISLGSAQRITAQVALHLEADRRAAIARPFFDLIAHLGRQMRFSERTFGPGPRTKGVIEHIRKELVEVEESGGDLSEWVDVILLAMDGAWRAGNSPEAIVHALSEKQARNERRVWPDWRTADPDTPIEHVRATSANGGSLT